MGLLRTLKRLALMGTAAAVVASGVRYYRARNSRLALRRRQRLPGLRDRAEVLRDRWGVPHIYAQGLWDLFFLNGYVQAQDRLWQMDFHRRLASGTLAEVLGPGALSMDRLSRRLGFPRVSQEDWARLEGEEREALEAFAAGVNAYLERGYLPLEFRILRYRPQPWRPEDSLAIARFMAWGFSGNWDMEILRSWTVQRFGPETMAELEPGYPQGKPLVVPPGAEARGPGPDLLEDYRQAAAPAVGPGLSNNWAVSGAKSVSGRPLLANDPHLVLGLPSLWYEVHLEGPGLRVAGVGMAGVPGIIIGHNQRIAWGVTAAMVDQDDLYVERLDPQDPARYEYQGRWEEAQVLREEFRVRGQAEPVVEEVVVTRHGPVIGPCIPGEQRPLALRTVAREPANLPRALLGLMRARNWQEFREALAHWATSPLNFLYADVDGNIGYQLAGWIPRRAQGHGVVPVPGWTDEYEWQGFVPFEELPSAFNPPTNWLATANNKIVDDDYPHFLSAQYVDSPRMERIVQLLTAKEKLSIDDFRAMQQDVYSIPGRELARHILSLPPKDIWRQRAHSFLRVWDGNLAADSVAATIVEAFFSHLVRRALEEKVGAWAEFFLGRSVHPLRVGGLFFVDAASWLLRKMETRPDWFQGKEWREAMEEALDSALSELRRLLGDDMSRWQWGRLHRLTLIHPLGQVKALAPLFNRGPIPLGGDANTVSQAAFVPHRGYGVTTFAVSWRQIIDLSDFNRSLAVLPGGQSGSPLSRHYSDQVRPWASGEYHPMLWDRQQVEQHLELRLVLDP